MTGQPPIDIRTAFEGANPFEKSGVVWQGDATFVLCPYCEDDNTAYKFRLETVLRNRYHARQKIKLVIEWGTRDYRELRDCVYARNPGGAWEMLTAEVVDTRSILNIDLHPGETLLTLNPRYAAEDLDKLLARVDTLPGIARRQLGETSHGRPLWLITAGSGSRHILISARVHPYETAPSYIVEGAVAYLAERNDIAWRSKYTYFILPMAAPDGVAQGLCRLSARPNGVDLSREVIPSDPLTAAYIDLINAIKPHFYLELHNWMFKAVDGLFYLNGWDARRFRTALDRHAPPAFRKKWRVGLKYGIGAIEPGGVKRYTQATHGSKVATLEIPWYQRSTGQMLEFGKSLITAVETLI